MTTSRLHWTTSRTASGLEDRLWRDGRILARAAQDYTNGWRWWPEEAPEQAHETGRFYEGWTEARRQAKEWARKRLEESDGPQNPTTTA